MAHTDFWREMPGNHQPDALEDIARRTARLYVEAKRAVEMRRVHRASLSSCSGVPVTVARLEHENALLRAQLVAGERRIDEAEARATRAEAAERRLANGLAGPSTSEPRDSAGLARFLSSDIPAPQRADVPLAAVATQPQSSSSHPCPPPLQQQTNGSQPPAAATDATVDAQPEQQQSPLPHPCPPPRPQTSASQSPAAATDATPDAQREQQQSPSPHPCPPPRPQTSRRQPAAATNATLDAQRALQAQLQEQCELLWTWHQQMRESVSALQSESAAWRQQQAGAQAERAEWETERAAWQAERARASDSDLRRANARAKALIRGAAASGGDASAERSHHMASSSSSSSAATTPLVLPRRPRRAIADKLAAGHHGVVRRREERIRAIKQQHASSEQLWRDADDVGHLASPAAGEPRARYRAPERSF